MLHNMILINFVLTIQIHVFLMIGMRKSTTLLFRLYGCELFPQLSNLTLCMMNTYRRHKNLHTYSSRRFFQHFRILNIDNSGNIEELENLLGKMYIFSNLGLAFFDNYRIGVSRVRDPKYESTLLKYIIIHLDLYLYITNIF